MYTTQLCDASVFNSNVSLEPWILCAIDNVPILDHHIIIQIIHTDTNHRNVLNFNYNLKYWSFHCSKGTRTNN